MRIPNNRVLELTGKLGIDITGFTTADILEFEFERLKYWLGKNYHAGMAYMENNTERRKSVKEILPSAKSVISVGINYYRDEEFEPGDNKISRYAWGRDYHFILWEKLETLVASLNNEFPDFEAVYYVDTGPVMDKVWAQKAGLGWIGKHSNVISREIGSWFFIGNIICNAEFDYNIPHTDYCGSCTACIDACPTNAIVDEYVVDASRCISYLTIENKGDIPAKFKGKFDNWAYGCDICQDVCPWNNKKQSNTNEPDFYKYNNKLFVREKIEKHSNSTFKKEYSESPINRARLKGVKRNLAFLNDE